jgi:DNA invertase Pin-like site-specific DNA recombinase
MFEEPKTTTVVGYVRVSTDMQGESGAGLDAQRFAIHEEVNRRSWDLLHVYEDVASGKSRDRRPSLNAALADVTEGRAGTLMVSKLDRLSRSVADFAALVDEARRGGWNIVVIDLGVDLSTPAGEMVATIMATLAQWERRMTSQRTTDALAARRRDGVLLGRPVSTDPQAEFLIRVLAGRGVGPSEIARELNAARIPTSQGGLCWRRSSVQAITRRLQRAA